MGALKTSCGSEMYVQNEPRLPISAWPMLCDFRQRHFPLWCPESVLNSRY